MTDDEKKEYVKEHFLSEAIASIEEVGRYWNGSISRTLTSALCEALEEECFKVTVREIPPEWEHVFYLISERATEYTEILESIAIQRSTQKENDVEEHLLAK